MSHANEVDLDRLADFTAGVLDTAEAERVAELIATDPAWGSTHARLVEADAAVQAALRDLPPEGIPADVAARLDAVLADVGGSSGVVVSLDKTRARRQRLAVRLAAAAAAVVALIGGVSLVQRSSVAPNATSADEARAGIQQSPQDDGNFASVPPAVPYLAIAVLASGTNYTAGTLSTLAQRASVAEESPAPPSATKGSRSPDTATTFADSLGRLTRAPALNACLKQVLALHPGTVTAVDYARFDGTPALVVAILQSSGTAVVAVGPNCGVSGADERAAVTY